MRWVVEYPRRAAAALIAAAALALVALSAGAALGHDPPRAADGRARGAERALAAARAQAGAAHRQVVALTAQVARWQTRAVRAEGSLAAAQWNAQCGKGRKNRRQGRH